MPNTHSASSRPPTLHTPRPPAGYSPTGVLHADNNTYTATCHIATDDPNQHHTIIRTRDHKQSGLVPCRG